MKLLAVYVMNISVLVVCHKMYLRKTLDFVIALLTAGAAASRPRGNSAQEISFSHSESVVAAEQSRGVTASQSEESENRFLLASLKIVLSE